MPLSKVNRIELNKDGTAISLYVGLDGFEVDSPIEISGQATQANGAVATFYSIKTVPDPETNSDGKEETVVPVDSVAVVPQKQKFDPEEPITVVARAAEVWITTLEKDGFAQPADSAIQAAWTAKSYGYAICQPGHTPPGW